VPQPDLRIAGRRLSLLDSDPSLLPACGDAAARRYLTTPAMRIARGAWALPSVAPDRYAGWLGMLVVDGLMIRTVRVSGLECCELLGPGDVIRPWDREDDLASLAAGVSWRALEETRVALLDDTFARMACHWPEVLSALMRRSLRRSGSLTVHLAIAQVRRADARLMALFWHLADRWGRVERDGIVVQMPLSHQTLADLVSARRPSVSHALGELRQTGLLTRIAPDRWLLRGRPPVQRPQAIDDPSLAIA
jgi:CRP/FNR family transcriptional regulator, cyclic AMP receptor protein